MLASRRNPKTMRVAVVVPALNEEAALRLTLPAALAVADELVVSDGGSADGTIEVARRLGARVVSGPAGRGGQLNRGAAATSAEILLFLHADTTLPGGALEAIRQAVAGRPATRGEAVAGRPATARGETAAGAALGGAFLVRFDAESPLLRLGAWLINLRTRLTRLPLGDQAHFVTREAFEQLGGYRDWPILEDLDFAWRLRRRGRLAILGLRVTTGARRFVELGVLRTVATNWLIWSLFLLGVSPRRLARLYSQIR
jgi:glycosyltransferase involved in cell wall biosynthesis